MEAHLNGHHCTTGKQQLRRLPETRQPDWAKAQKTDRHFAKGIRNPHCSLKEAGFGIARTSDLRSYADPAPDLTPRRINPDGHGPRAVEGATHGRDR